MGSRLDHDRIHTVISSALGSPSFQPPCLEQLAYEMLELGWGHFDEIGSGIEAGDDVDAFDERVASQVKVADPSYWFDEVRVA